MPDCDLKIVGARVLDGSGAPALIADVAVNRDTIEEVGECDHWNAWNSCEADGLDGRLVDFYAHVARLQRSLGELSIPRPLDREELLSAFRQLVRINEVDEGMVYVQVSRGTLERDFIYPEDLVPNVFMFTQVKHGSENEMARSGIALKSVADIRWARRDIKSVNLLGQVMAKQEAHESGFHEALMVDKDGHITECGATSFFTFREGTIITRELSRSILPGVTRQALITLCDRKNISMEERLFTLDEVYGAEEAFISGASTYVLTSGKNRQCRDCQR